MDPKPTKELVSCGVEMILDNEREDKQPMEPKPTKELVSCGVEIMLDKAKEESLDGVPKIKYSEFYSILNFLVWKPLN